MKNRLMRVLLLCFVCSTAMFGQGRPRIVPQDVVVVVIDSGIDFNNEIFTPHILKNEREIPKNGKDDDANGYIDDYIGFNAVKGRGSANDKYGHGTQVSSVLVGSSSPNFAAPNGLNDKIRILPVKWINGHYGKVPDLVAALQYTIDYAKNNTDKLFVVNASLYLNGNNAKVAEQISELRDLNILFIGCAGNNGRATTASPASFPLDNIISVGATQGTRLWFWSNEPFTIAAEGAGIRTRGLRNFRVNVFGTSFAAPLVTRVAALLISSNPHWPYHKVKKELLDNSADAPMSTRNYKGRLLDPYKTLMGLAARK